MRDYQRQKNNKYLLPPAVYHRTIWTIRDYYRLVAEAEDLLTNSPPPSDGMPKDGAISDPVFQRAQRRYELKRQARAIDGALVIIPKEYRTGVWSNIQWNKRFPNDAGRATYARYKSKYIYEVASKLGLIER